jgi:hypothetical protein
MSAGHYAFVRGFPDESTTQRAYDEADLSRAIEAYRFFYPTVSGAALFKGTAALGIIPNKVFGTLDTLPKHVGFTLNSDTPYAPLLLDLARGPMVVELPAGPLICIAMDINQLWVADLGLPGPAAGKGDKVVFLPPGHTGERPAGYRIASSPSNKMLVGVRSLPLNGDVAGAIARIKTIKVYPLRSGADWPAPKWLDLTPLPQDTTPLAWEDNLLFWRELHGVVDSEPANPRFRTMYGLLAALGIEQGKSFAPDARTTALLEQAASAGNAQLRVASFGDRRHDRIVWPDRQWEWAALRFEDGDFNTPDYVDLHAREKWFYQAIGASPAMFKRDPSAGSLYWLGLRDATGATLDGGKSYKLSVPQPVPGRLFWSLTVYDTETRSQVVTKQGKAALRSLFELKGQMGTAPLELHFGPGAPPGHERAWIETLPGRGWFSYFRVYGPEPAAFNGCWKPGDFERVS